MVIVWRLSVCRGGWEGRFDEIEPLLLVPIPRLPSPLKEEADYHK